jgi:hypothetical protein
VDGTHHPSPRTEDVLRWLCSINQAHCDTGLAKVLNLSPHVAFQPGRLDTYLEARRLLLHRLNIASSSDGVRTELNITPALSSVHVHHDEEAVISTVRVIGSYRQPCNGKTIAKIWFVWPSEHMRTLFQRGPGSSYGDTAHSLENANGAVWFAQRDGETVVIPGDLAHSTFTLQSCYLLSSNYPSLSLQRVPLVPSDMAAGTTEYYAVKRLVDRVEAALQRPFDDSRQFLREFWNLCAYNIPVLRRNKTAYDRLINILAIHMSKEGKCISCAALGIVNNSRHISNPKQHAELHTENNHSMPRNTRQRKAKIAERKTKN